MYCIKHNSMKNKISIICLLFFITSGCEQEKYEYVFPEKYFPAYPESYWIYSNGTTVKVDPDYQEHHYYPGVGIVGKTEIVYVPRMEGQYVYGYKITQNSTQVPLKELLRTTKNAEWIVDYWNGTEIRRKVETIDTTITLNSKIDPLNEDIIDSVILVCEFIKDNPVWIYREAYAPNIGLIRREINISDTSIVPHVEKELIKYFISK